MAEEVKTQGKLLRLFAIALCGKFIDSHNKNRRVALCRKFCFNRRADILWGCGDEKIEFFSKTISWPEKKVGLE